MTKTSPATQTTTVTSAVTTDQTGLSSIKTGAMFGLYLGMTSGVLALSYTINLIYINDTHFPLSSTKLNGMFTVDLQSRRVR